MNTWDCIAWEDVALDNGKTCPTPRTKQVEVPPEMTSAHILAAFKRKFPHLRNHTVHLKSNDFEQVVTHRGPGDYPIAVDRPVTGSPVAERSCPIQPSLGLTTPPG